MNEQKIYAWHFLSEGKRLGYSDGREVVVGKTLSVDATPELCVAGLHASERAIDALSLGRGPIACRVAVWGEIQGPTRDHLDKLAGQHRQVIAMVDAAEPLREFVIDTLRYRQPIIAELFVNAGLEESAREIAAIDWALIDDAIRTLDAAGPAAGAAARAALDDAVGSAARDPVREVVGYAAMYAAMYAEDAARAAARAARGDTARDEAWDTARDEAWNAARDAVRDAARDAARSARGVPHRLEPVATVRDAARAAARAARGDTARDEAWNALNVLLERRLYTAMGITERRKRPLREQQS